MNILKANINAIRKGAEIIKSGGLVAFPTETVYGLGADGLNPIAVAKIFEVKRRPSFNPLILHIAKKSDLAKFTNYDDSRIDKLIDSFWPGPLTLVLPKKKIVPGIVTSGNETVAIRMPNHKVALDLIKKSGVPIAAPSANKFGNLSPTNAIHVYKSLGESIELILDGGKCKIGLESTIIEVRDNNMILLRPGGLSKEEVEDVVGKIKIKRTQQVNPNSPGQLPYHYSPSVPLYFLNSITAKKWESSNVGVIYFKKENERFSFSNYKVLSSKGDLREAAANLFKFLHEFENANVEAILVERIKEKGLGFAIMDRLKRGSKKYYDKV
jgi:L-threonylcarbamoyladenylate synthase